MFTHTLVNMSEICIIKHIYILISGVDSRNALPMPKSVKKELVVLK